MAAILRQCSDGSFLVFVDTIDRRNIYLARQLTSTLKRPCIACVSYVAGLEAAKNRVESDRALVR